jgi:hypothetical protein
MPLLPGSTKTPLLPLEPYQDGLRTNLRSIDVRAAIKTLFYRIYSHPLLSLRSFSRSAVISSCVWLVLFAFGFLRNLVKLGPEQFAIAAYISVNIGEHSWTIAVDTFRLPLPFYHRMGLKLILEKVDSDFNSSLLFRSFCCCGVVVNINFGHVYLNSDVCALRGRQCRIPAIYS